MFTVNEMCDGLHNSADPIYSSLAADPAMEELIALFVDELPSRVTAIRQAAAAADWPQARLLAHQLKGAGGSYGFAPITTAATRLEHAFTQQPGSSEAAAALRDFASVCGRIRAADASA